MKKLIDREPPALTGDKTADLKLMNDYLYYLREQLNWIITLIYKEIDGVNN